MLKCSAWDTKNIRVFKPNAAHNLKLARLSPASFSRLAGNLLLVSLRVVGSASWQLAGQCLPWALRSVCAPRTVTRRPGEPACWWATTLVVARHVIEHEPSATGMEREALFALDLLLSAIVLAREPSPPLRQRP